MNSLSPGRPAGRRRRDDRLVRQPGLDRGQRQRRPRLRPEPAGGLMATRTLDSPPSILPLYARAAAPMIPGASLLPFVPGGGGEIPDLELELARGPRRSRAGRRLRQGLRLHPARPPPAHLPARARLPAAHGGDGRRQLPLRRRRPRPRREPDRPAPAGSASARSWRCASARPSSSRTPRAGPSPSSPRPASTASSVWESDQHHAAPRRRRAARRWAESHGGDARPVDGRRRRAVSAEWRLGGDLGRRYAAVSGRPQPDPHALADREAARLPRRDRPRDVDQGALPGGAGEPPARRLHRRGALPQADPAARPRRVRQRRRRARRSTSPCATQSAAHPTSTAA